MNRKNRRNAYKYRELANQQACELLHSDMIGSMSTWSWSRCSDCGAAAEASWFLDKPGSGVYRFGDQVAHLSCTPSVCHRVQNCPGEVDGWMNKLANDHSWTPWD